MIIDYIKSTILSSLLLGDVALDGSWHANRSFDAVFGGFDMYWF